MTSLIDLLKSDIRLSDIRRHRGGGDSAPVEQPQDPSTQPSRGDGATAAAKPKSKADRRSTSRVPGGPGPSGPESMAAAGAPPKPSRSAPRLGRRSTGAIVGLDIQPGCAVAVQAQVNGGVTVRKAAGVALGGDVMRDGEVVEEAALAEALKGLFHRSGMSRRVRVGVANQRTVLRTLQLPPITDARELDAAVRFQAEDQIPMPLDSAVLDYHPLGIIETSSGRRLRVLVVAAQRDMVEKLLAVVRDAGLRPEGLDLSAFALIRSLHRRDGDETSRILYLNIGGLTNMAIAEGTTCCFTRVVGGGTESMAAQIAERRGIALTEARELLTSASLLDLPGAAPITTTDEAAPIITPPIEATTIITPPIEAQLSRPPEAVAPAPVRTSVQTPIGDQLSDVRTVLENSIREIVGEVRNCIDFHRSQPGGGEVSEVILSGPALEIDGFADSFQAALGIAVRSRLIELANQGATVSIDRSRLAVAAGLATEEAPR